ncbi:YlbF family regulator [Desulfitobacterium sp.]|uniref:YlbF family regulator n=1 Tax=Desulfitobacterium sp. TaxID=49981 RepID=UPI002B773F5C|nr:YlbF family regulator [Desulfitobacterium sp.]HVJ48654.1 YlbF family regulator [Desulfitobacterium sp.]
MTADILAKAEALAAAIGQSSELEDLRTAEQAMLADEQAQKIIADFNQEQQRFFDLQSGGQELSEKDQKAIDEMEKTVESHPLISAYLQTQDHFTQMLDSINSILASAIAADQDQASGCSTCGSGCGDSEGGCSCEGC